MKKTEDLLPPGKIAPDLSQHDEHYRYFWSAQYDSRKDGPWVDQFDGDGKERSTSWLDWGRVVRVILRPVWDGLPILELRVNPQAGEMGLKKWQNEIEARVNGRHTVREVLGIETASGETVYVLHEQQGNRVIITTDLDV